MHLFQKAKKYKLEIISIELWIEKYLKLVANEFIDEDYIKKASYYASSISVLNTIRKDLFNRINQTPLFDTKQFTNDFCWSLDQMIKEINKNYK